MNKIILIGCIFALFFVITSANSPTKKVINVELGGHCNLGAAPVGPGGSWQTVEKNVEKKCPPGSSCRRGACNCDDLPDGTVMSQTIDSKDTRVCRRIAGQKCTSDNECFDGVSCTNGKCTCKPGADCVDRKNDITILA